MIFGESVAMPTMLAKSSIDQLLFERSVLPLGCNRLFTTFFSFFVQFRARVKPFLFRIMRVGNHQDILLLVFNLFGKVTEFAYDYPHGPQRPLVALQCLGLVNS